MIKQKLEIGKWYKRLTINNDNKKFCIYRIIKYKSSTEQYVAIHYCGHDIIGVKNPRKDTFRISIDDIYEEITKEQAFLEIL